MSDLRINHDKVRKAATISVRQTRVIASWGYYSGVGDLADSSLETFNKAVDAAISGLVDRLQTELDDLLKFSDRKR